MTLCDGMAIAPAFRLSIPQDHLTTKLSISQPVSSVRDENLRFEQACTQVAQFLEKTKLRIAREVGKDEAEVFASQQLLLQDPSFRKTFYQQLKQEQTAESALQETLTAYRVQFRTLRHPLFRQRIFDLEDVWGHVLAYLITGAGVQPIQLPHPVILIGKELLPSQLAHLDWSNIRGIITDQGGVSSHTTVLASSMHIPYISQVHEQHEIFDQELIILDGHRGLLYVNPTSGMQQTYRDAIAASSSIAIEPVPSTRQTQCGQHITLRSNVNILTDITDTHAVDSEGIGLLRTEMLYASRPQFPNEEEQYQLYQSILKQMSPNPVTFRTFDLGGDKQMRAFPASPSSLSPMGWRGLRIHLDRWDLLRPQLRALLRASTSGNLRVLFPMLSTYEELLHLKERIAQTRKMLIQQGYAIAENIQWGLMIETPAAALQVDQLAPSIDFVSIGTNDLMQFLMAAERGNSRVSHLLQPTQPALLRLLQIIIQATASQECSVSICGEMAAQPLYLPLLLGLGLRDLSLPPKQLPLLQQCLPHIRIHETELLVQQALQASTSAEIFHLTLEFAENNNIISVSA